MFCSTCGSPVPEGRASCERCGARVASRAVAPAGNTRSLARDDGFGALTRAHVCPRCGYQGEGISYFSRGSRIAALVGVTMVTMGAMGAGGLIYYLVRRDHLACPHCGKGWGSDGERALVRTGPARTVAVQNEMIPAESWKRGWSTLLFVLAPILLVAGMLLGEIGMLAGALLAAGGGVVLRQAAGRERERRREALITSLQLPVLKLAARQGGRLTVTEVAAHLGWPMRRAEKILQSLDDGIRVDSEVTDEGVIVYEFRELAHGAPASELRLGEGGS